MKLRLHWRSVRWMRDVDGNECLFAARGRFSAEVFQGGSLGWMWSASVIDPIALRPDEWPELAVREALRGREVVRREGEATSRRQARRSARRALEAMRRERAVTSRRAS